MNTGKVLNTMIQGYKIVCGLAAYYFVRRATTAKAQELVENGGIANAVAIGIGQEALALVAGAVTYRVV